MFHKKALSQVETAFLFFQKGNERSEKEKNMMMNYKVTTMLIFMVLMLLTIFLVFSKTIWGLAIMGLVVPVLIMLQVVVVLKAGEKSTSKYVDGSYEND